MSLQTRYTTGPVLYGPVLRPNDNSKNKVEAPK